MALYLSSYPQKQIGTFYSKHTSVHQAMLWQFIRGDINNLILTNNGGKIGIQSSVLGAFSSLSTSDIIGVVFYSLNLGLYNHMKSFTLPILNKIDDENITIDVNYTVDYGFDMFVNIPNKTNHYAELDINWLKNLPLSYEIIGTLFNRHNSDYIHEFNVNPILKNKATYQEQNDGLVDFYLSRENSGNYNVIAREYYDNSLQSTNTVLGAYYYENGVKQLGSFYNFNFAENVIFDLENTPKTKLISSFERPTLFKNYPFVLSVISQRTTAYNVLKYHYDSNNLNFNTQSPQIVPDTTDIGLIRLNIETTTQIENSSYVEFQLSDEVGGYLLTEKLTVDVDTQCKENPVFLQWLSHDASLNCWLFSKVQELASSVSVGETFEPFISDLSTAVADVYELEKEQQDIMVVGCEVPLSKAQGLKTLPSSLSILMLTNPDTWQVDGVKWKKVRIQAGTFKMGLTDEDNVVIQFTIILPKTNLQSV